MLVTWLGLLVSEVGRITSACKLARKASASPAAIDLTADPINCLLAKAASRSS